METHNEIPSENKIPDAVPAAESSSSTGETEKEHKSHRLISLDAFRGLTIFGMLLVNNASMDTATPKHLTHAAWNQGINFADLVFPWFLFIVGVAIPYSRESSRRKNLTRLSYFLKAFTRCITLILLGCLIDSSLAKRPVFDLGVLQIIGISFFTSTLLYEMGSYARYTAAVLLLIVHWILLRFIPYPGSQPGIFTESQNIIRYINTTYLAQWNLQGLISVIPTTALVIIGTAVGDLLRCKSLTEKYKLIFLLLIGVVLSLVGWLWSLDLPFNKPVWTASYIVTCAGLGSIALGFSYFLIDIKNIKVPAYPFVVFGMNAITAYVAPILVKVLILREWTWTFADKTKMPLIDAGLRACTDVFGKENGGWLFTIGYILLWWFVMLYLYKKKIFVKV